MLPYTHAKMDPAVQLCGDSEVAGKWINGKNSLGQRYQEKLEGFRKPCTTDGKRRWPTFSKRLTTM